MGNLNRMYSLKKIYHNICYAMIISVLVLKVGVIFITITTNYNAPNLADFTSPWENTKQAHYIDLFTNSAILYSPLVSDYIDKSILGFPTKHITVNRDIVFSQEKTITQFFPVPSICSHTGIYMCLRL